MSEKEEKRMKGREESRECMGCGRQDIYILHKIKHKPNFHTLCTNCLLTHHLPLFCQFCFQLYQNEEEDEEDDEKVMCIKCPSFSHLSCIPNSYSHAPPSFLCPSCSDPHFLFFNSDPLSARALVCAAQISAISMTQAADLARLEADKRVKEAAFAKKRAKEALDTLASFASIQNHNNSLL